MTISVKYKFPENEGTENVDCASCEYSESDIKEEIVSDKNDDVFLDTSTWVPISAMTTDETSNHNRTIYICFPNRAVSFIHTRRDHWSLKVGRLEYYRVK
jgi:hypothetical protein